MRLPRGQTAQANGVPDVRRLGADEITLCDMSLREGLVLDYIARHRKEIAQADRYPDIRRRSVVELAERCNYWPEHATQVARLAMAIFEETRAVQGLTDREREWLEYAALLHDIGVHISYEGHHKHSYYLIKNGDLRGFEPEEVDTMALVARYHRRATPKKGHPGYGDLPHDLRQSVKVLAACLASARRRLKSGPHTSSTPKICNPATSRESFLSTVTPACVSRRTSAAAACVSDQLSEP